MYNIYSVIFRLSLAGILAGIIGLERELHSKEAGIKTHFLVGIGAALVMIVSKYGFSDVLTHSNIDLDPSRIAAQVISGVGFLGAGTIILERKIVKGLTTAAGIWTTAGIGITIGSGLYAIGIFSTFLVLVGLEILQKLFKSYLYKAVDISISLSQKPSDEIINILNNKKYSLIFYKLNKTINEDKSITYSIECRLKMKIAEKTMSIVDSLECVAGVVSINIEII